MMMSRLPINLPSRRWKNRCSSKFTPWKVGAKVWLETTSLHMGGHKKLQMKCTGPFEVEEVISWMAFCLHIASWWKIHPVFHASLLTAYKETVEHGPNYLWPPPDLVDGEEEYEVEPVLEHQGRPGHCTCLIHWEGYSTTEDTWEPKHNLGNSQPLIIANKITHLMDFLEYNHYLHSPAQKWITLLLPLL